MVTEPKFVPYSEVINNVTYKYTTPKDVAVFNGNAAKEAFFKNHINGHWKLRLNIPADYNDPLTKDVISHLAGHEKVSNFKVGSGGEESDGKGITIYVGQYDDMVKVAKGISAALGDRLPALGPLTDDVRVMDKISARFDARRTGNYNIYGPAGLTIHKSNEVLNSRYFEAFYGNEGKRPTHFEFQKSIENNLKDSKQLLDINLKQLVNDFGATLIGQEAHAKYMDSGKSLDALPEWMQRWRNVDLGYLEYTGLQHDIIREDARKAVAPSAPPAWLLHSQNTDKVWAQMVAKAKQVPAAPDSGVSPEAKPLPAWLQKSISTKQKT